MSNILLVFLLLFSCIACEPNTAERPTVANTIETVDPVTTSKTPDYGGLEARLQGTWKRTDYPFGTLTFKDKEVRFDEGEGNIEPAKFEAFQISNSCSDKAGAPRATAAKFYLRRRMDNNNSLCEVLAVAGDQLTVSDKDQTYHILYKKQ